MLMSLFIVIYVIISIVISLFYFFNKIILLKEENKCTSAIKLLFCDKDFNLFGKILVFFFTFPVLILFDIIYFFIFIVTWHPHKR